MGTLSGGGTEVIEIGERVLIGANAGTGISLGDDCVIEAGTYITAGMKIEFEGESGIAGDLSGSTGLRFIRHSLTGAIEVSRRKGKKSVLNPALHSN